MNQDQTIELNLHAAVEDNRPHSLEIFMHAREAFKIPHVRNALLAEYASLCQLKAELPVAAVTAELLQKLAGLDAMRIQIKQLLDGYFVSEETQKQRNAYLAEKEAAAANPDTPQ